MPKKIMLTGITGFVGKALAERLLAEGHALRALVRNPAKMTLLHPSLEVIEGDVRDPGAVRDAMRGCELAYFLVHGLGEPDSFEHEEALAAQVFTQCSNDSGLERILYLGGLGSPDADSPHLRSRHLTGKILALGRAKVLEFRASIVLGAGSTSYEIMKALVARVPVIPDPRNLRELCQPLHVKDLLDYLAAGIFVHLDASCVVEIGGPDRIPYSGLLEKLSQHAGLSRKTIPLPELDPRLLGEVFELVVPEYGRVGRHLIESLVHPTVVMDDSAMRMFPWVKPKTIAESLESIGESGLPFSAILSREHLLRVVGALIERFPQLGILRGIHGEGALYQFVAKQMAGFK
ncbi:MAG: NAD-dependent epimerase/dehydratase family protein [Proteobacteria bacterium]|nr:NAD-dependent epimerase/dehydratase family protein [Pseudomonadota bacterium]